MSKNYENTCQKKIILGILSTYFIFTLAACGAGPSSSSGGSQNQTGLDIFTSRFPGANTFTCSTCHTVDAVPNALRRVGHDLTDSFRRPNYKNGVLQDLRSAVNNCVEHWMVGEPLSESSSTWQILSSWFEEMAPSEPVAPLSFSIVDRPTVLTGGDMASGITIFNNSCVACHGLDALGTDRGPSLAGTTLSPDFIATKIRRSGPVNTDGVYTGLIGGRMPFWAQDQISDQEIRDIITFLDATVAPMPPPTGGGSGGVTDLSLPGAPTSACAQTHPAVGSTANLRTFSHNVSGLLRVVDDCTIEITNFNFDGGGINVRLYTGVNGNFSTGSIISQNMLGMVFTNDTVRLRFSNSFSLNNFNSLSVWCVPVSLDFGSGVW